MMSLYMMPEQMRQSRVMTHTTRNGESQLCAGVINLATCQIGEKMQSHIPFGHLLKQCGLPALKIGFKKESVVRWLAF